MTMGYDEFPGTMPNMPSERRAFRPRRFGQYSDPVNYRPTNGWRDWNDFRNLNPDQTIGDMQSTRQAMEPARQSLFDPFDPWRQFNWDVGELPPMPLEHLQRLQRDMRQQGIMEPARRFLSAPWNAEERLQRTMRQNPFNEFMPREPIPPRIFPELRREFRTSPITMDEIASRRMAPNGRGQIL